MNEELRKKIYETGSTVPEIAGGGFWYLEAKQNAKTGYAVFSNVTTPRAKDSKDIFDFVYFRINGYDKDVERLEEMQKHFAEKFDGQKDSFLMNSYYLIDIDLMFNRGPVKIDDVFQFTQQYKVHLQQK